VARPTPSEEVIGTGKEFRIAGLHGKDQKDLWGHLQTDFGDKLLIR